MPLWKKSVVPNKSQVRHNKEWSNTPAEEFREPGAAPGLAGDAPVANMAIAYRMLHSCGAVAGAIAPPGQVIAGVVK